MFAVVENGGRQVRVHQGDVVRVDLVSEVEAGQQFQFDKVFLANGGAASVIGQPVIEGATVSAEVVEAVEKGPKLEIQKVRRRKNSRRHTGHRQKYTAVKITDFNVPGLEIIESDEPEVDETPVAVEQVANESDPTEATEVATKPEADESADEK